MQQVCNKDIDMYRTFFSRNTGEFIEKINGYSYSVYGYMNVETKEYYSKETIQWEINAGNRTGTVEQMDANVEAMARDLQEILRIGAEQKRLWEMYKGR